ncbi:hypothetical protein RFI_35377 [Reticulomyxa filosa]|uniref:U-box domain-containing protein n=1 Tax=Reticulomyxa filosa TaxID=46433 RepID=X6LLP4_RETFI|nr:hypothetical protein RFI_35377 [Reticulomyxa filosa]|eukprot:ETO02057.1 hypothetical protein RFI_35377 [Reticulomyxa filosa]
MNEYNKIIKGKKIDGVSLLKMSKNDWMNLFHFDMLLQACVVYDLFNQICVKYPIDSNEGIPHDIPKEYLCPISKSIMKDPVIALNGITYDRSSIMNQYQNIPNYYSLMNNGNLELYPDFALQQKIQKFLENLKHSDYFHYFEFLFFIHSKVRKKYNNLVIYFDCLLIMRYFLFLSSLQKIFKFFVAKREPGKIIMQKILNFYMTQKETRLHKELSLEIYSDISAFVVHRKQLIFKEKLFKFVFLYVNKKNKAMFFPCHESAKSGGYAENKIKFVYQEQDNASNKLKTRAHTIAVERSKQLSTNKRREKKYLDPSFFSRAPSKKTDVQNIQCLTNKNETSNKTALNKNTGEEIYTPTTKAPTTNPKEKKGNTFNTMPKKKNIKKPKTTTKKKNNVMFFVWKKRFLFYGPIVLSWS